MTGRRSLLAATFVIFAALEGPASACTVFPIQMNASHLDLVTRTPRIALVRVDRVVKAPGGRSSRVEFQAVETLKGEGPSDIALEFVDTGIPPGQNDDDDFDRHRDEAFWRAPQKSGLPANRSRGVLPSCALDFAFVPGRTYLGFFEANGPGHIHAFERIAHPDDAWLARVRTLLQ